MGVAGMVVVVVVVGGFSCFSTARYDAAHLQRVASIDARYAAERRREDEQDAALRTALDEYRAQLIPTRPGSHVPVRPVDERADIVACRRAWEDRGAAEPSERSNQAATARCLRDVCWPAYVGALLKTYFAADLAWVASQPPASTGAGLEALLAFSHNQEVLRYIDAQAATIAQRTAQAHDRLAAERRGEVQASEQQRDAEIASGRAQRRARLQAAANASAAMAQEPISARQPCVGAPGAQLLSLEGECRAEAWGPDRLSSSHSSQSPPGGQSAARR